LAGTAVATTVKVPSISPDREDEEGEGEGEGEGEDTITGVSLVGSG